MIAREEVNLVQGAAEILRKPANRSETIRTPLNGHHCVVYGELDRRAKDELYAWKPRRRVNRGLDDGCPVSYHVALSVKAAAKQQVECNAESCDHVSPLENTGNAECKSIPVSVLAWVSENALKKLQ